MLLSLRYPSIPLYGEEAFRVCGIASSKYSHSEYETFYNIMKNKSDAFDCTPRDLEKAIWAATYESTVEAPPPPSKKRKK